MRYLVLFRFRSGLLVLLAVAGVLAFSPAASASNRAPNPGFETDCGAVPCDWSVEPFVDIARDTTAQHTGNASLRVAAENVVSNGGFENSCLCEWSAEPGVTLQRDTAPGTAHSGVASLRITTSTSDRGAGQTCITGVGGGTHDARFWYRTSSATVTAARLFVFWYSGFDCTGNLGTNEVVESTPQADGVWHPVTGTVTAPPGTVAASVYLRIDCSTCGVSVNFDDVELFPRIAERGAGSTCITGLAPGAFDAGFWYRTLSASVTVTRLFVFWYSNSDCTGLLDTLDLPDPTPRTDGVWEPVATTTTAPAGTQAASIYVRLDCSPCNGVAVNFDDVELEDQSPTAVALSSFAASSSRTGVSLTWRTASEQRMVGFNVYRQQRGKLVKLNRVLIPSVFGGTASGHRYSWLDRNAPRSGSVKYRLQAISPSGKPSWVGSATAAPPL